MTLVPTTEERDPAEEPPLAEADHLAWQAEQLVSRRRTAQARALVEGALATHPHHAGLLVAHARADYLDDDYASARALLAQVLAAEPKHDDARLLMHLVAAEEGETVQAEELILELLREQPGQPAYYALYARLMLRTLHLEKAGKLADEAVRLAPDDPHALQARALCDLANGKLGHDNAALVQLVAGDPHDMQTLRLVVVALIEKGRHREARQLAAELLRMQPTDPHALTLARTTRYLAHWSLLPLWPMQRWGWGASIAIWIASIAIHRLLQRVAPDWAAPFGIAMLVFVVYSWVWPGLLRRLMKLPKD